MGTIRHIFISPEHDFVGRFGEEPGQTPMAEVESIECVASSGIEGDRYFDHKPNYKGQITFFEWETYQAAWAAFPDTLQDPSASRRNVITVGLDLNALIGEEFKLGGLRFGGSEESAPCVWMDRVIAPGAHEFLKGRGGLRARILEGGSLQTERGCRFGAALLCGGKSERMGVDKASIDWNGQPLWKRTIDLLKLAIPRPIYLAAPKPPDWGNDAGSWIQDAENARGPLGGLLAGLRQAEADGLSHLAVLAVDLPQFDLRVLRTLQAAVRPGVGLIPRTQEGLEPLAAVYPIAAKDAFESAAANRQWKLQDIATSLIESGLCSTWDVPTGSLAAFRNLNSPGD